jgi:hypothetical protein
MDIKLAAVNLLRSNKGLGKYGQGITTPIIAKKQGD